MRSVSFFFLFFSIAILQAADACYYFHGSERCLELRVEASRAAVSVAGGAAMPLTGEVAIRFPDGVSVAAQEKELARFGLTMIRPHADWPVYGVARPAAATDLFALSRRLVERGLVRWAQPVWMERPRLHATAPNDTFYVEQWHHPMIRSDAAWELETGNPASVIAVVDSGVDTQHPDLWSHLLLGLSFVPSEPYVDPNMNGTLLEPNPYIMAHGTAVSGLAAATGDNGIGVAGVCWNCGLLPIKYIGNELGQVAANRKLDALKWAVDNGAWVVNNSWSAASDTDSSGNCIAVAADNFMSEAIAYGLQNGRGGLGTVMVWASGNSHCDTALNATLATDDILTVSALRKDGTITDYSNWGVAIDIAAPAGGDESDIVGLTTTDATAANKGFNPIYSENGYPDLPDLSYTKYFNGTSAASPVVAGAVGLMLSAAPYLTAQQAIQCVKLSAAAGALQPCPYGNAAACYGAGLLDVRAMVENAKSGLCGGSPECTIDDDCDPGETCHNGLCVTSGGSDDAPQPDDGAPDDTFFDVDPQNDTGVASDETSQDDGAVPDDGIALDEQAAAPDDAAPALYEEGSGGCSLIL